MGQAYCMALITQGLFAPECMLKHWAQEQKTAEQ